VSRHHRFVRWLALASIGLLLGCSAPTRTPQPAHYSSLRIFAAESAPFYAIDLGPIKVEEREGTVDSMLPDLAREARALGADALVIDEIESRFETMQQTVEQRGLECPHERGREDNASNCTHAVPKVDEVLVVTMRGHALRVGDK
jgi:hypothetical protein